MIFRSKTDILRNLRAKTGIFGSSFAGQNKPFQTFFSQIPTAFLLTKLAHATFSCRWTKKDIVCRTRVSVHTAPRRHHASKTVKSAAIHVATGFIRSTPSVSRICASARTERRPILARWTTIFCVNLAIPGCIWKMQRVSGLLPLRPRPRLIQLPRQLRLPQLQGGLNFGFWRKWGFQWKS